MQRDQSRENEEKAFGLKCAAGEAIRIDFEGGFSLDLIHMGDPETGYYLGRFPVNQGLYETITGENPSFQEGDDCAGFPVESVTYGNALFFCEILNKVLKNERGPYTFTLPTIAQWEEASRIEGKPPFRWEEPILSSGRDECDGYEEDGPFPPGWGGDIAPLTRDTASSAPNGLGFHDLCENVWEWSLDKAPEDSRWHLLYGGTEPDLFHPDRGDGFRRAVPDASDPAIGFRVALVPGAEQGKRLVPTSFPPTVARGRLEEIRLAMVKERTREEEKQRDAREKRFLEKIREGRACRIPLKDGTSLDLVRIEAESSFFFLGRFPVTRQQYQAVMGPYSPLWGGDVRPMPASDITQGDAITFCEILDDAFEGERGCFHFTLPTEGQWTTAARGGGKTRFSGGDILSEVGWYGENAQNNIMPVGMKRPNQFGLYDMSGTIGEWCRGTIGKGAPYRGGDGLREEDYEIDASCHSTYPEFSRTAIGFRVALEPTPTSGDVAFATMKWPAATQTVEKLARARERHIGERLRRKEARRLSARKNDEKDFLGKLESGKAMRFSVGEVLNLDLIRLETSSGPVWLGRFPVTRQLYKIVMGSLPPIRPPERQVQDSSDAYLHPMERHPPTDDEIKACYDRMIAAQNNEPIKNPNHPVQEVGWDNAMAFCQKLNKLMIRQRGMHHFTLPTTAQWLMAAKGNDDFLFSGGDRLDEVGWFRGNSNLRTHEVGTKKANGLGFYDMSGNVLEWVRDERDGLRALLGGSWRNSAERCFLSIGPLYRRPDLHRDCYGFRIALV